MNVKTCKKIKVCIIGFHCIALAGIIWTCYIDRKILNFHFIDETPSKVDRLIMHWT